MGLEGLSYHDENYYAMQLFTTALGGVSHRAFFRKSVKSAGFAIQSQLFIGLIVMLACLAFMQAPTPKMRKN